MSELTLTVSTEGVTSPQGFLAGAVSAGIRARSDGRPDLALLYSERPCSAAALFTASTLKAAPVLLSQRHLADGKAQAVIVNSGCANAYVGDQGRRDAEEMARLAASKLRLTVSDVVVASTGVTGHVMPMEKLRAALPTIALDRGGGEQFARAIMTTDTVPKQASVAFSVGEREYRVGGCAKGAGMIHPNLATMLAFLTTDAPVESAFLQQTLREAVDCLVQHDLGGRRHEPQRHPADHGQRRRRRADRSARAMRARPSSGRPSRRCAWRSPRGWPATPRGRRS